MSRSAGFLAPDSPQAPVRLFLAGRTVMRGWREGRWSAPLVSRVGVNSAVNSAKASH